MLLSSNRTSMARMLSVWTINQPLLNSVGKNYPGSPVPTAHHLGHLLHEDYRWTMTFMQKGQNTFREQWNWGNYSSLQVLLRSWQPWISTTVTTMGAWLAGTWEATLLQSSSMPGVWMSNWPGRSPGTRGPIFCNESLLPASLPVARKYWLVLLPLGLLRSVPSHEVRTAAVLSARDLTGRNVALVREESGEDPWTSSTTAVREVLRERTGIGGAAAT